MHTLHHWAYYVTVQFGSRWYLCAQKSPYTLHPVSQKFPKIAYETVPGFIWFPFSSFQGRLLRTSSLHASLLQVINGVMSLALCLHVVSQAPQHFRSSEEQTTCDGCFARQSICSVSAFTQACPGHPHVFQGGCRTLTHATLGFPFHFSLVTMCNQEHYSRFHGRRVKGFFFNDSNEWSLQLSKRKKKRKEKKRSRCHCRGFVSKTDCLFESVNHIQYGRWLKHSSITKSDNVIGKWNPISTVTGCIHDQAFSETFRFGCFPKEENVIAMHKTIFTTFTSFRLITLDLCCT